MTEFMFPATLLLFLVWAVVYCLAAIPLGQYAVDRTKISTSGLSSGAAMATQLHVAYSGIFMGVGMVAGNPYYCAQGSQAQANGRCMDNPDNINVADLTTQTTTYASSGQIDPTTNLYGDRVFIFHGTLDTVVLPGVSLKVEEYYGNYVNSVNIKTNFTVAAQETFPTVDKGLPCSELGSPYIGICNYDGAYEILNHIYSGLRKPTGATALPGQFYEYDQTEFFSGSSLSSMDDAGYVYVPAACVTGTICKLHVALHGCHQGRYAIGDQFARQTGYNEVGELNNIIILYPQVIRNDTNLLGCWDWWGYTGENYATKNATQPLAIWRMVQKVAY